MIDVTLRAACEQPMSGSKFFPIEGSDGKQQLFSERDCSAQSHLHQSLFDSIVGFPAQTRVPRLPYAFGPHDSYYEHNGDVYCHFHYSTRFATKCAGCGGAILKQFVEMNQNLKECWRPECGMIHKAYAQEEADYDAITLKEDETNSNGMYLDAIRMAEKFIPHVEVLFAVIDELEAGFAGAGAKRMSHVREAWPLCRKTTDLFNLFSHTQYSLSSSNPSQVQSPWVGVTQEPLALGAESAHYLKILIRVALTGAPKLEREHSNEEPLIKFLGHLVCLETDGADPNPREAGSPSLPSVAKLSGSNMVDESERFTYGYRSLSPDCAGESPFSPRVIAQAIQKGLVSVPTPPTVLCAVRKLAVEEDSVRLGTYQRWHSHCVKCVTCGKVAAVAPSDGEDKVAAAAEAAANGASSENKKPSKVSSARRPPANVDDFRYEQLTVEPSSSSDKIPQPKVKIYCTTHATSDCRSGFSAVSRLEQYAFLLNVVLRSLYFVLHKRGGLHLPETSTS
ncbi:hypothetical protein FRC00_004795 [Tulasnella sp. 408]|nr:hypothetical protein FRC00_004795 [Tulasnella sp. 408]